MHVLQYGEQWFELARALHEYVFAAIGCLTVSVWPPPTVWQPLALVMLTNYDHISYVLQAADETTSYDTGYILDVTQCHPELGVV